MATLTPIIFPDEGEALDITGEAEYVPATYPGGDQFANDGKIALFVENSTGGPVTVTASAARRCSHGFLHDAAIVVANNFSGFVKLDFDNERFSDSAGIVSLTYSATGLNVAVVRRP